MQQCKLNAQYLIGYDIGGTKLSVVVADWDGNILHKIRRPTEAKRGPKAVVSSLVEMSYEAMARASVPLSNVAGVGVSCGGPLDTETGIVYAPPNLPGWDEVPLKAWLEEEFSVPVFVENDANACALAEWSFGAGRGFRYMVYITMSTGIGGGIIIDGNLYRGPNDTAGEVGHMTIVKDGPSCGCGKRGCLESLCSGPSIARRAREKTLMMPGSLMFELSGGTLELITAETVVEAARQNDVAAREIVDETARYMAIGLGNIVNIINPEIIVIGTILVKAKDLLLGPIRHYLRDETWERVYDTVRVVPAGLGNAVGDLSSIAVIRQGVQIKGRS